MLLLVAALAQLRRAPAGVRHAGQGVQDRLLALGAWLHTPVHPPSTYGCAVAPVVAGRVCGTRVLHAYARTLARSAACWLMALLRLCGRVRACRGARRVAGSCK
jgi:hypothetical protein